MNCSYLQHITSNKKQEQLKKEQEYIKKYIEFNNNHINSYQLIRTIFCFFVIFFILMLFQYELYNNNYTQEINYCIKSKIIQHKLYNNTKKEAKQTTIKIIRI